MPDGNILQSVEPWRSGLGLLPVPLFSEGESRYVLLNGSKGNFCLDLRQGNIDEDTRSFAWSSDVGHYVRVKDEYVEVQRWDQSPSSIERYTRTSIHRNFEQFYQYLEQSSPTRGESVVSHATSIFRRLRKAFGPDKNGVDSLKAFLTLLACEEAELDVEDIKLQEWGLNESAIQTVNSLDGETWSAIRREFRRGKPEDSLQTYPELVLRHATGQIFQEAHYEAVFQQSDQLELDLSDVAPRPVNVRSAEESGVHFTPGALARTLVEESLAEVNLGSQKLTIFDPACGSGEFLRESLRQLQLHEYEGHLNLLGWDTSAAACKMAQFSLAWEVQHSEVDFDFEVRHTDSLTDEWPNVDLILMNPPFVSWEEMNEHQEKQLKEVLGDLHEYRPDFASGFIWKAHSEIDSAAIGSIVPGSFFDSDSATKLRGSLSEVASAKLVARLGSHNIFPSAQVDAGLMVTTVGKEPTRVPVTFWADHRPQSNSAGLRILRKSRYQSENGDIDQPVDREGFSLYPNPDLGKDESSWNPRPYEPWRKSKQLEGTTTVSDLFDVKQGARTGNKPLFVLKDDSYEELPSREKRYFRPAVDNDSIVNGVLKGESYVFYPHGDMSIKNERQLINELPFYYKNYLETKREDLKNRNRANPDKWWELNLHRTWQEEESPKIVSKYFGSRGSFAFDIRGEFAVVQGFAWLPRKTIQQNILLSYISILNSSLFFEIVPSKSKHVGGGQWNLSSKYIGDVPLPDLTKEKDFHIINTLSEIGEAITKKGLNSRYINPEEYKEAVESVYGFRSF